MVVDGRGCMLFPYKLHVPNTPPGLMCPVVSILAGGRTGGTELLLLFCFFYSRWGSQCLFMIPRLCAQLQSEKLFAPITHVAPTYYSKVRALLSARRVKRVNLAAMRMSLARWTLHQECAQGAEERKLSAASFHRVKESLSGFSLSHWKGLVWQK